MTMIERVARAHVTYEVVAAQIIGGVGMIYLVREGAIVSMATSDYEEAKRHRNNLNAICAIEAMRKSTLAMTDAVYNADLDIYFAYRADGDPGLPEDVWRVMIDAALAEVPTREPPTQHESPRV